MTTPPFYILTKGERDPATWQAFREFDPWLVTHDDAHASYLRRTLGTDRVLVSGVPPGPRGKVEQQQWHFDSGRLDPGQWVIVADDNIHGVRGIPAGDRAAWEGADPSPEFNRALQSPLTAAQWADTLPDTLQAAERNGAHLVGFASNGNPLSRYQRYGPCSFVWGKLTLWRVDPAYTFDPHITVMDDWCHTAAHLVRYGTVLVDYDTCMVAKRYEPGGLGSLNQRADLRAHDIAHLTRHYPGLFTVRGKPSGEWDLRMVRNRATVGAWREAFLARTG